MPATEVVTEESTFAGPIFGFAVPSTVKETEPVAVVGGDGGSSVDADVMDRNEDVVVLC